MLHRNRVKCRLHHAERDVSMRRLVLILIALLLASPAAAQVWRIACDENFPPYNFIEQGRVAGLDAEIIDALVRRAGAVPQIDPQPWVRVQDLLERGEVDAAFQFVGRPDRFEKYFMVGPFRTGQTVFAGRPDSDLRWNELSDLRGYRIGTIRGYTYGEAFDTALGLTKEAAAGDNSQLVRMLAARRVDLIVGDRETLTFFARREGVRLHVLAPPLAEVPRYIAVPRTRPDRAERLAGALAAMRRDGTLAAILKRWE
ncbi:MAG: substrate-binding periplasmic protein [Ferrovibrio sp.]|jgi:polar amino acid transport system substrate-binding protein|uniref:substrate-binding periplasmic protein n=1 Tax=Ferrovibrio sp. TaxID=1917215 RepID=UPI00391D224B